MLSIGIIILKIIITFLAICWVLGLSLAFTDDLADNKFLAACQIFLTVSLILLMIGIFVWIFGVVVWSIWTAI